MKTFNRLSLFVTALALAIGFAGLPQVAHAQDNLENYRQGMPDLIDYSDRWLDEVDGYLMTIAAKPELACSEDYAHLLLRGNSVVADFVGSAWDAPADLAEAHGASAAALTQALEGARLVATACDGSTLTEGKTQVAQGRHDFKMRSLAIRHYLKPIFIGIALPSLPVVGPPTN